MKALRPRLQGNRDPSSPLNFDLTISIGVWPRPRGNCASEKCDSLSPSIFDRAVTGGSRWLWLRRRKQRPAGRCHVSGLYSRCVRWAVSRLTSLIFAVAQLVCISSLLTLKIIPYQTERFYDHWRSYGVLFFKIIPLTSIPLTSIRIKTSC